MKKPKYLYEVYRDDEYMGETWAVSEAQAINNIRFRSDEDEGGWLTSQYSGGSEWEACRISDEEYEQPIPITPRPAPVIHRAPRPVQLSFWDLLK